MFARMKKNLRDRRSQSSSSESFDDSNDGYRSRYSNKPSTSENEQFNPLDYVSKIEELAAFDACVETADALAAASPYTTSSSKIDKETGLRDCSVLVSPDGELLLVPQEQTFFPSSSQPESACAKMVNGEIVDGKKEDNGGESDGENTPKDFGVPLLSEEPNAKAMMALNGHADVESSVFMGNDLIEGGDRAMNSFSATGWAPSATSLAIRQSEDTLRSMASFVETLVLIRKDAAARVSQACDQLPLSGMPISFDSSSHVAQSKGSRSIFTRNSASSFDSNGPDTSRLNSSFDITTEEFGKPLIGSSETGDFVKSRVGPLLYAGSTLFTAIAALEQYHSEMAQKDANRWRKASFSDYTTNFTGNDSVSNIGVLNGLRRAADDAAKRGYNREKALREMQRRLDKCEKHLAFCKQESERRWNAVHHAEEEVTRILEEQTLERSRQRERIRLEQMRETFTEDQDKPDLGVTDSEIWDLVSSVTESLENGSFEPTGLPDAPIRTPIDKSLSAGSQSETSAEESKNAPQPIDEISMRESDFPIACRTEIEHLCRLPELRSAAMAADEAVEDTGGALLNVLSTLDTTRRSARVAAESCLLGVANAQARTIRSLISLERESIEERLRNIEELERIADNIDVRGDLDKYITTDKQQRSGSAWLGIDDDGGIASALAVLCSHVDGSTGGGIGSGRVATEGWDIGDDDSRIDEEMTPEKIEDAIGFLFSSNALDGEDEERRKQARGDYETSVNLLCRVASDTKSKQGKTNRSTICYAMNQKRSSNTEIPSKVHFDGICRVFYSVLSGCDREAAGLSNGKMCMMLSQTFYMVKTDDDKDEHDRVEGNEGNALENGDTSHDDRSNRIYVKTRLMDHPLWADEEFWDQALYQCVAESLTHSGVFAQFDLIRGNKKSEWTEHTKMKWHDLKPKERAEAATQVQAVVFAQLGALAHSMIEFGCGIERASAFVRRMAIRNQLPISQRRMLLLHLLDRDRRTVSEDENAADS